MSATVIVKIIGYFFKVPLKGIIGVSGFGYFNAAYGLFNTLYALSVAGMPVAVARMVAQNIKYVPGTFELSLGAQFFAEYTDVDAVIALGCVIQGDTRHFDFICQGVTQGITQLQIQWNMPIAFGVLTVGDMQQALDRCGGRHGNKGDEAAATAINMVKLQIDMEAASPDHEPDRRNIN